MQVGLLAVERVVPNRQTKISGLQASWIDRPSSLDPRPPLTMLSCWSGPVCRSEPVVWRSSPKPWSARWPILNRLQL